MVILPPPHPHPDPHHFGHHLHLSYPPYLLVIMAITIFVYLTKFYWANVVILGALTLVIPFFVQMGYTHVTLYLAAIVITGAIVFMHAIYMWRKKSLISLHYKGICMKTVVALVIFLIIHFVFFLYHHHLWAQIGFPIANLFVILGLFLALKDEKHITNENEYLFSQANPQNPEEKVGKSGKKPLNKALFGYLLNLVIFIVLIELCQLLYLIHELHHRHLLIAGITIGVLLVAVIGSMIFRHLQKDKKKKQKKSSKKQ
jgi:hypothetical protein